MAAANAAKGLLFVAASAGLIYHGVKRHCARVEQDAQAAKDRVYRHTVAASQHILLNFVNQSQLMRLTA